MDARLRLMPNPLILLAFVVMVVFLGSNFVVVKFSNAELAPFWGAGTRHAVAAVILFGLVRALGISLPRGRALKGAALYGALTFGLTYGLLYVALLQVTSGTASVVFATIPLLTLIFAVGIGQERFTLRGLVGALIVIIGITLAFLGELQAAVPIGYLLAVLGGAAAAALSGVVVKHYPPSHPFATNAVGMAVGTLVLLGGSLAFGESWKVPELLPTWLAVGWLTASSVFAFALIVWLLHRWTASAVSYSAVLFPLVTILVAAWLNKEGVSASFAAGGLLVLLGVYVGALKAPSVQAVRK